MLPVIVLLGRPNVGKSTLFNALTRSHQALVADFPGLTRDRQYGLGEVGERDYWVVDTGGIAEALDEEMEVLTDRQVEHALNEADIIFFMVDAQSGLTSADREITTKLRQQRELDKVILVVNKVDRDQAEIAMSEFYELGFPRMLAIAAQHRRGLVTLVETALEAFPEPDIESTSVEVKADKPIRVAVVGRPNVGKSTLINRLLGEDRVVVCDRPGTTRDKVEIPFEHNGKQYLLIDTAGIRRRSRVAEKIEIFSVMKSLQAIEQSHITLVLLDASEAVTDQDLHLIGKAIQLGRGLIIAFNKWDGLDDYQKKQFDEMVDRKIQFATFARRYTISALHGSGVGKLYYAIDEAYESMSTKVSTPRLTELLNQAVTRHQPPLVGGRRIKMRYAHMGSQCPLSIIIHGKQVDSLPGSYKRYLTNFFIDALQLVGVSLQLRYRQDGNPYSD